MAGSFLQTAGIASQASDAFDTARQQRRLSSQQEQKNQSELDDNTLYREIVKMAYEHEAAKEAAAASAAKAKLRPMAPQAPTAPGSAPAMPTSVPAVPLFSAAAGPADEELDFANGGEVGKKFGGIYDDTKIGKRFPTHFIEALSDFDKPGYKHGGLLHLAVHDIVHHANSYADGGEIDPAADENRKKLSDELLSVGVASPQDTNVVVPGLKVTPNPTAFPGRLINASGGSQSLLSPGGHSATGDGVSEIINGKIASTGSAGLNGGDPSIDHSTETNTPGSAPFGVGLGLSALGFGPLGALFSLGVLASNAGQGPDTSLGEAVARDRDVNGPEVANEADAAAEAAAAANEATAAESGAPDGTPEADAGDAGADSGYGGGFGGDDGEGYGGFGANDGSSDGSDGGDDGGGDGGGEKNGGILWNYVKARMAKKSKKGAVKFKGGGKLKAGPGGQVRGPGTGTSDSVPASLSGPGGKKSKLNLSAGEYVLSADTTRAVGKPQLDKLQARYHKQVR